MKKFINLIIFTSFFILFSQALYSQTFTGFEAFKTMIEFESQRYLMNEVYQISSEKTDQLAIDKLIVETDYAEGFMFVMMAYKFNGQEGVVLTSFNSQNFSNTNYFFININLSRAEFEQLNAKANAIELGDKFKNKKYHQLLKFNERIVLDVFYDESGFTNITIWIDQYNRHTFTTVKWDRALKKLNRFYEGLD